MLDRLRFDAGVIISSGRVIDAVGPNVSDEMTTGFGTPGDPFLDSLIPGYATFDACVLEFDFECPNIDVVSFEYVFASEEYNEYVNSSFNNVFGFELNGSNIAIIPGSAGVPVAINNLNCGDPYNPGSPVTPNPPFCDQFNNNDLSDGGGTIDIEADGVTVLLGAESSLVAGVNHIKLAIGDAGDSVLDSWVFLREGSFQCRPLLDIPIDIKPGSCPNSWNRKSNGVLPVAMLGTEDFDVTQIDVSSVTISRADGTGGSVGPNEGPPGPHSVFEDVGTPFEGEECDCHEAEGDGILDLSMKFKTQDVANLLPVDDPNGALVPLVVSGTLLDGTAFTSRSDCVRLVPPGTPPNQVIVESAAGSWVDATPLDNQLDGGGFGSFTRTYPHTTVLTLTAPSGHNGNPFVGWRLDEGDLVQGSAITLVVNNAEHTARAVFKKANGCGFGFELALLVPPLMWLYERRRRRML